MFFFRHPKPVVDGRAVAMLVVQQKASQAVSRTLLIVEKADAAPAAPTPVPEMQPDETPSPAR